MTEQFLHYLFETRKLGKNFITTDGEKLEVEEFGTLNHNSGPDFLVAKVKYKQTTWAGHIEFHKNSSDWFNHGHQFDNAYKNVVAHFVYHHDQEVYSGDYLLPTIELKNYIDQGEYEKYEHLTKNNNWIACQDTTELSENIKEEISKQLSNRLNRKSNILSSYVDQLNGDFNMALLTSIVTSIGGKVNKDGFTELAAKLDFRILQQLNFDSFKIQAYLHGISGLLPQNKESVNDQYVCDLIQEFNYQKKLFNLIPLSKECWKFSTFRPASHPTNRIAQITAWLSKNPSIKKIINQDIEAIKESFEIELCEFWENHYHFNNESKKHNPKFSDRLIQQILINAVVPALNLQSILKDQPSLKKKAVNLLKALPAESNRIIKHWKRLGVEIENAADSQALIELKNEFCSKRKCLKCMVGKAVMRK